MAVNMLYFGGALNQSVLGLPVYVFAMLLGLLAVIGVNAGFYFLMWSPLKNLQGLYHSFVRKENAVFVFDQSLNFILKSEKKGKLIYDESVTEAKRAQPDWDDSTSGQLGRVRLDLLWDPYQWSDVTTPERQEIDKAVEIWNEANPDDQIRTLLKFSRYLHTDKIRCNVEPFYRVSWLRIFSAFPQERLKSSWAGYLRQLSEQLTAEKTTDLTMLGVYILVFCGIIDILLIGTKALHLF